MNSISQQLFINSYYVYIKHDISEYVVDLDDVYKSVGFNRKENAKKILEKYFKIDVDYKSINGWQNKQQIMMNIKTFKKFCMRVNTKEAEKIHDYYLLMEEIIHEYTREQLELKDNENKKLQDENKRLVEYTTEKTYQEIEKNGHVYVFSTDKIGIVKIGRTKRTIKKRIAGLQTALIDDIEILLDYHTSNDQLLESIVHYILDRYRCNSNREHFECNLDYIKLVIENAGKLIHTLKSTFQNIAQEEIIEKLGYTIEFQNNSVDSNDDSITFINKEDENKDIIINEIPLSNFLTHLRYSKDPVSFIKLMDLYKNYTRWFSNNDNKSKLTKKELQNKVEEYLLNNEEFKRNNHLHTTQTINGKNIKCWKYIRFIS